MSKFNVEVLPVTKIFLGEGPHWDPKSKKLYYVDIFAKTVHCFDPLTLEETKVVIQEKGEGWDSVTLVVPIEDQPNKFVISVGRSLRILEWNGKTGVANASKLKTLHVVDDGNPEGRFNDGKCDSNGRLWAGTMGYFDATRSDSSKGILYKLENDGKLTSHLDKIDISNGLAWSADNKTFYYVDSYAYRVDAFDYDISNGTIKNRRKVYEFETDKIPGIPDGMTIDLDGNLWVAVYGGGRILHIDPHSGKLLNQIKLPASNITSVTFGGTNLEILYATSAQKGLSDEELAGEPLAGALFQITNIGTKGLAPGVSFKGKI